MPDVIYLDSAASTPPFPEVLEHHIQLASRVYANAASAHQPGKAAAAILEETRTRVAAAFGLPTGWRVVCTSGATEANNWIFHTLPLPAGARVVISAVEHACVRNAAMQAAKTKRWNLEILPVQKNGTLSPDDIDALVDCPPDLLSIMAVNNETGVLLPVAEIGRRLRAAGARTFFHVDAVQAVAKGFWPSSLEGISAVTLSAHKFHGLKGCGFLLLAPGAELPPLLLGGGHENGLRSGTVNVPGAAAAALALEYTLQRRDEAFFERGRRLERAIRAQLPDVQVLGENAPRVPWICMLAVPGMRGDALVRMLDMAGVAVSSGSACASGKQGLSPTLTAMKADFRRGHVRLSIDVTTPDAAIDAAVTRLRGVIERYALPPRR